MFSDISLSESQFVNLWSWWTERKYLIEGKAYLEYMFNLNSPLNGLISMFFNLVSSLKSISANIALVLFMPVTMEPRNSKGLSRTESIYINSFSSLFRENFTISGLPFSIEIDLHFLGFITSHIDITFSSTSCW